ncbi:hypothetical protein MmiAt1_00200 [Methanimicrococcus sp. At1]|uniref:Uncharacterized protein n=1 Tax=Methanimicrococcus hacksteinii TaxID=3028293 RepID=A0ABU3VM71_9EURY|nr:hypothetical protein [Methanimicrococcus sp. At1]MDV0444494.1 hypothetical protein [Methanimicrococcus sp. At1]
MTENKINENNEINKTDRINVELDQNGIKTNKEIDISKLKTAGDILKELKINEETALLFFKGNPIPFDEKFEKMIEEIGIENIHDGDFRVLKVIFDE